MLQVKIKFRLKYFNLGLILNFLCVLALIIHELGLRDKGNWESNLGLKILTWIQFCPVKYIQNMPISHWWTSASIFG